MLWFGGSLALVSTLVAVGVVTLDRGVQEEPLTNEPAQIVPQPSQVPLASSERKEALSVAARWIHTAVARRHVERSWDLTDPALRAGFTRETWQKGDIPVVPYPVKTAKWRFDYSYLDRVGLKVALFPKDGSDLEPVVFDIDLRAAGRGANRHWLVDEWAPTPARDLDTRVTSKKVARQRAAAQAAAEQKSVRGRLDAKWLFLPVSLIVGIAVVVIGSFSISRAFRSRRARREWQRHRQQVSEN